MLKLVVEESSEAARFNMEPDYSMRSSINIAMPNNNLGSGAPPMNFGEFNRNTSSFYFEEVKQNQ